MFGPCVQLEEPRSSDLALPGCRMEGCLHQAPPRRVKFILVQVRMQVGHRDLFTLSFFIYFPAQSGPSDDRGDTPHLPSSSLYSCGADGIIHPRASGDPFLKGEVLFVPTDSIPQPI
jgi:hypothetical protein